MLRVDAVTKRFKLGAFGKAEKVAVRDVSFELAEGRGALDHRREWERQVDVGRDRAVACSRRAAARSPSTAPTSSTLRRDDLRRYYRRVQGVFQDPFSSYNPVFRADRVFGMVKDQFFKSRAAGGVGGPHRSGRSTTCGSTPARCSASIRTSCRAASSNGC